jgi:hypothetical protein
MWKAGESARSHGCCPGKGIGARLLWLGGVSGAGGRVRFEYDSQIAGRPVGVYVLEDDGSELRQLVDFETQDGDRYRNEHLVPYQRDRPVTYRVGTSDWVDCSDEPASHWLTAAYPLLLRANVTEYLAIDEETGQVTPRTSSTPKSGLWSVRTTVSSGPSSCAATTSSASTGTARSLSYRQPGMAIPGRSGARARRVTSLGGATARARALRAAARSAGWPPAPTPRSSARTRPRRTQRTRTRPR